MALHGVDIASYQKDMDCSKVKADFIIIKATQGTTYVNPNCNRQYAQAKAAGKLLGLYHYATGVGAEAEADFFINNIKNYVKEAILCLDWEHNEVGGKNPMFNTPNEVEYVYRFMKRVHDLTGVYPLLYMSASVTRRRDWSKVAQICELWDAQYASSTKITDYQDSPWRDNKGLGAWKQPPAIHQYSSSGSIEGYRQTSPGKLDMDIAYLTRDEWLMLARGSFSKTITKREVNPEVIMNILDNKYGSGTARALRLKEEGYDAAAIQKKINELYKLSKELEPIRQKAGDYWYCLLKI